MLEPVSRDATYEDLLRVPEHLIAELIDGELYVSPRPAPPHGNAASSLGADLNILFQRGRGGPGGWWIQYEPELHLGRDVFVPDLAGWRITTMATPPTTAWFDIAPDWVCEVLSPVTGTVDRLKKLPRYGRYGIQWAWLVDPLARSLEIYQLNGGLFSVYGGGSGDDIIRAEPFEAVELELAPLWLPTPPSPQS